MTIAAILSRRGTLLSTVRAFHSSALCARQAGDGGRGPSDGSDDEPPSTPLGRGRRRRQRLTERFFDIAAWQHNPVTGSGKPSLPLLPSGGGRSTTTKSTLIDADTPGSHPFSVLTSGLSSSNAYSSRTRAGSFSNAQKKTSANPNVNLQQAITLQEYTETLEAMLSNTNPRDMRRVLDSYVIGQNMAKQSLATAIYNHYTRVYHNLLERRQAMSSSTRRCLLFCGTTFVCRLSK